MRFRRIIGFATITKWRGRVPERLLVSRSCLLLLGALATVRATLATPGDGKDETPLGSVEHGILGILQTRDMLDHGILSTFSALLTTNFLSHHLPTSLLTQLIWR